MADLSQLAALIDHASNLAALVDEKEASYDEAASALRDALIKAKSGWNEVYELLLKVAQERLDLDDEGFTGSKLGALLKAELEKSKRGR